ncbi:MAG: substrate-binding domain-containing protein [Spirochaetales bacterium]|nr:substrate-binding domain-containing protein [Spirochaetales bacterium]
MAVILINPCNSDAAKTMVEKAAKAGIPVISVDRGVNGAEVLSHIASDNVAGGVLAGQELLALVGEGAKVVELEGIPGASAAVDRGKGFNEAVVGKLNVVARQPADFNRDKGFTVMQNIIQANKDIRGVFAHNDEMALGAIKALEAAGLKDVIVIGFDAVDDAVAAVKAGNMKATVAQKPSLIGSMAVETAVAHIKGEAVQKQIPVPLELVK